MQQNSNGIFGYNYNRFQNNYHLCLSIQCLFVQVIGFLILLLPSYALFLFGFSWSFAGQLKWLISSGPCWRARLKDIFSRAGTKVHWAEWANASKEAKPSTCMPSYALCQTYPYVDFHLDTTVLEPSRPVLPSTNCIFTMSIQVWSEDRILILVTI